MAEQQELIEAFKAAGAVDDRVWHLARTDIPVADALREVQDEYPKAFREVFDARKAPMAEVDKRIKQLHEDGIKRFQAGVNAEFYTGLERKYGSRR